MIKAVLKDGGMLEVPEGATVLTDTNGTDKGTMTVRITIPEALAYWQ